MPETDTASAEHLLAMGRVALWACIAIAAALLALFALTQPAHALPAPPGHVPGTPTVVVSGDAEAEEAAEGEEEADAEEAEEEEEEEEEFPPAECLLQTVRAQVSAYPAQSKVQLLVHYSSTAFAEAMVGYRLKGGRGALRVSESRQHLADKGLIRLTKNLSKGAMTKVLAAKSFTVELHIPAAPRSCQRFETRHLTIEHESSSRLTWLQSDSIFGT